MRPYFEKMTLFGSELTKGKIISSEENQQQINEVEAELDLCIEQVKCGIFGRTDQCQGADDHLAAAGIPGRSWNLVPHAYLL